MDENTLLEKEYLGDGLYVGWDGFHIYLWADREHQRHWIALDPNVAANFNLWGKKLFAKLKQDQET